MKKDIMMILLQGLAIGIMTFFIVFTALVLLTDIGKESFDSCPTRGNSKDDSRTYTMEKIDIKEIKQSVKIIKKDLDEFIETLEMLLEVEENWTCENCRQKTKDKDTKKASCPRRRDDLR